MAEFGIFDQNGTLWATVSVVATAGGDLQFTVAVDGAQNADIEGLFFNVDDPSCLDSLVASGDDVTASAFGDDAVQDLGNGANISPAVFDAGIRFGGPGQDNIRETTFILSSDDKDLSLALISEQSFGLRLTSTGIDEEGSLKLIGEAPPIVPPIVGDDDRLVDEEGLPFGSNPTSDSECVVGEVTFDDPDGQVVSIAINGTTVGVGDTVAGTFGTLEILTITQDGPGNSGAGNFTYKYTLETNLDHPVKNAEDILDNQESFSVTVTDDDGLTSGAGQITIDVKDDVPSVDASELQIGAIVHDETVGIDNPDDNGDQTAQAVAVSNIDAAFTFGADGEGDRSLSLTQADGSGFSGQLTNLQDSAILTAGGDASVRLFTNGDIVEARNVDGNVVLALAIAADGTVNLEQPRGVVHPDPTADDEPIQVLAADGSGLIFVTAMATDGDGDMATDTNDGDDLDVILEDDIPEIFSVNDVEDGNDHLEVANEAGDTAAATTAFDAGKDGPADPAFAITDATTGDTAAGTLGFDAATGTGTLDGENLYTISIDNDGNIDFELLAELPGKELFLDLDDIDAGGPINEIRVGALGSDEVIRISGFDGGAPALVNASNDNVGIKNGNLDPDEELRFEVLDENDDPLDITAINIGTKTAQGGTFRIALFNDGQLVDGPQEQIIGKNGTIVVEDTGVVFDEVSITNEDGNAIKVGLGDISITIAPDPLDIAFDVTLTDGDGDMDTLATEDFDGDTDVDSLVVTIDPNAIV